MLNAFKARPIVEFRQRDKSKIESILAYGDRLLVGLQSGSLRIYRVNEPTSDTEDNEDETDRPTSKHSNTTSKAKPVDLLREEEKFSRRPIHQLAIIKEANILVSLSDNHVALHDLQSYALQDKLEKTKGASTFAATSNIVKDPQTGIPSIVSRLAVAVKRKVYLWTWQDMELSDEIGEMTFVSTVKSITWANATKMVVGMDPGFVLADIVSQELEDIYKPGVPGEANGQAGTRFGAVNTSGMGYMGMGSWVPKPMATKLQEGQLLLAKDVNTLFINEEGKALEKRQIPWALAPEVIAYSYPYMLGLQPAARGCLEVRNPDTLSLLQTVPLPNASILHVPQPNISLAHAGKGFLVASDRCVWRMGALDYDAQVDELVSVGHYDEAISLLGMLEDTLLKDKAASLRQIKMMKAKGLFDIQQYRDSLDLFSEAMAPPEAVVSLYPQSIAGELSLHAEEKKDDKNQEEEEQKDEQADEGKSNAYTGSFSRAMFGKFLSQNKSLSKKPETDASSILSGSDAASVKGAVKGKPAPPEPEKPLTGKDLKIAVNELCAFLVGTRTQLQKYVNYDGSLKEPLPESSDSQTEPSKPPFHHLIIPSSDSGPIDWQKEANKVATLTDTTLFRAYMFAKPTLAGSLFRLDNFCDPVVVKEKLYETGRYSDLIDFLRGKKMHREALELLEKFGKDKADEEVAADLKGPRRTVGYLQQLPPELIDIILEFAEWPLRTNADLAMEVFTADTENAETLPRHRVLEFLSKIDLKLSVQYLEHIINELDDLTPDFHQRLIDLYLERLKSNDKRAFSSDQEKEDWKDRMHSFLKSSAQYTRARVFRQLPSDEPTFYEARAIVLSKMGNHKQALQIYVFQLRDFSKAEDYCNSVYLSSTQPPTSSPPSPTLSTKFAAPSASPTNTDSEPNIYHTLLSLYLAPPPPHEPNWPPALDLLSRHGARLPASSVLSLVPANLAVKDLERYFRGRIRSENALRNQEQIQARLRGLEKVRIEAALLLGEDEAGLGGGAALDALGERNEAVRKGRNRRVVIGEERHCAVCHKRFGGSAIRVYPDNSVVHYGCMGGSHGRASAGFAGGMRRAPSRWG